MLRDVQRILAQSLTSDDPSATLSELLSNANELSEVERTWLETANADGLRLAGLLIQKLRFERLTAGEAELAELFATDPQQFMELYRRYCRETPARSYFPAEEAKQFRKWREGETDSSILP